MPIKLHTAFISVGSNLGRKLDNCSQGIAALTREPHTDLQEESCFYKTAPVDFKEQDWFVNSVVKVQTNLNPQRLLGTLKSIEIRQGRLKECIRYGPRILDMDIILYDHLVLHSSRLTIPHPKMHKRRFVLQPVCDIDPYIIHPVLKKRMRDLLAAIQGSSQKVIPIECG